MAVEFPLRPGGYEKSAPSMTHSYRGDHDHSNGPTSSRTVSIRQSRNMTASSASSAQMMEVVALLKRRCAEELGASVASSILGSYSKLMEWINSERLRRLPTEGSAWDKVLAWAQSFAEKFNDFDLAIERFTDGDYDGAEIAFGYCILLLELGEDNAAALQTSFGFFFQRSLDLVALLDRIELFNVLPEITEQLILAYADLVTLVSDVALRFYQVIRSNGTESIEIYTTFASSIDSFQARRDKIVDSMWLHLLEQDNFDITKSVDVKTLRLWLATDDNVLKSKAGDYTKLVTDRQQLTGLWLPPYLTRFLNSNRQSLTISGVLGSGKSVLAGSIVDILQKSATRRSYSVIFIPVDGRVKAYANSLHVACSLLSQLLELRVGNVQLYRALADAFEVSQTIKDNAAYETLLWNTVSKAIQLTLPGGKETIIVVDGIDEVSENAADGQALLKRLKDASAQHDKMKLITLSQPSALGSNVKPDIDVNPDLTYDDIFAVVTHLILRNPHYNQLPKMQQNIMVDKIVNASSGSFLWAKMVTKSLIMENTSEKLTKAVESVHKSPKSIQDVTRELFTTSNLSEDTKLLVLWLTISERPLTIEELALLYAVNPHNGTLNDTSLNVPATLEPAASLVFLQNGLLYLRHSVIKQTLATLFEQHRPIKEPTLDFISRLFAYLKATVKDKRDPSFASLNHSEIDQKLYQSPLIDYAVRYWPKHYLSLASKTRETSSELKKEFMNALPISPTVALIEKDAWRWFPTPLKISWHTTAVELRKNVFENNHPIVLQSAINLARLLHNASNDQSSAHYYYLATQISSNIFSSTHPLTVQCANHFLEVTSSMSMTTRTELVTCREKVLVILIESYNKQYSATSEQVISMQRLLVSLYRSVKEEKKATDLEESIRGKEKDDATDEVATRHKTGSVGVRVKSRRGKDLEHSQWDFDETSDRDSRIKIDVSKRIEELLHLAQSHASRGESAKAEQSYVEAWYRMSTQTKSSSSVDTHLKKISLAIEYANFLKSAKRDSEAAALLTGVWEEYQSLSIARNEQVSDKFVEVAKVMKSVGLTTVALSIFKHCSSTLRSLNKTDTSIYKEVQQNEQTTQRELMQKASSSSTTASNLTEEVVTEIFTSMDSSKTTQLDSTSVNAIKQIVSNYMAQHRYKESTNTIKRTLRGTWTSLFDGSIEDVGQPNRNPEFSIDLVEQLILSYRLRHRLGKATEYREKLYRALKQTHKIDDKLVQHNVTELFKIYEQTRATDKIVQLHRELLEDYKKTYGSNHAEVIKTLFTLAKLTSPEPVSVEYYRQIVTILSRDSDTCHPDAIEPLKIVAAHYWSERRYPGAIWAYLLLFRTFVNKGKEQKALHDASFASTIYSRYVASLRATSTDVTTIHDITHQYRRACINVFGATHKNTIDATLYLARICEGSKRYKAEAISLYEEILKQSSASEYHAEIKDILDAYYEEQSLEAARSVHSTASSEQIDKAISVIRRRVTKNRSEYGWTHHESLEQLKEMTSLYSKQSRKEEAYKELTEANRQIVSTESSSESLIRGASAVAASYLAIHETHRGLEVAEEMRWQLVTKDSSNSQKFNVDLTNANRSTAIYIAQLEHALQQDTSTSFNEIYLSIITEIVYYEDFQRSIRSNVSLEVVFSVAARLRSLLTHHHRDAMKSHVENELVSFFFRHSGEKAKIGDVAQVRVLVNTMLEYVETHEIRNFPHSVSLASIEHVRFFMHKGQYKQACDLAQTSFRYINTVVGYKSPSAVKYGLILALAIADIGNSRGELRSNRIQIAGDIIRQVLKSATEINMSLAGIPLHQTNCFVSVLGEEKDYITLEWYLTILWQARETHRNWKPAIVLELGYRLVLARFLLGKHDLALELATDIAYNLRRVYGATHLATLEVNVLLSQLCISTGLAFQSQKGAEMIANRFYKRAIGVHENVLRALTLDPLGLGEEDDVTVLSTEPEPMDLSVVVDKNATQGTYARKHLHLLKLALQRFGGYPKGEGEYEAIYADTVRAFPEEMRGIEGLDKWNIEKFGHGKADGEDGALNTNISKWALTEISNTHDSTKTVHANGHAHHSSNGAGFRGSAEQHYSGEK